MNYEFIDTIRQNLESENIFIYGIIGAKMCAMLLLIFSVLEKWGKNAMGDGNPLPDLFSIFGFAALIISSDFIFTTIEGIFSSINNTVAGVDDTMYSDLMGILNEDYMLMMEGADGALELLAVVLSNLMFFLGYIIVLLVSGIVLLADMSMVCGYLLTRVFLLELLQFLFPIAVALSTLKVTSGLLGKWVRIYIGVSLLGAVYIGIIKFCSLVTIALQKSFQAGERADFWDSFLNLHSSAWAAIITIIVVFTVKAALFSKATSFINSYFN
jgi:hypothetical protein